ncbi:4-hydroxy-3-methylbut-2-enyl diphosphate reductase [Labrys okinawensis]|uniref:4-hydroxy-3-methylbut-2-enyl diphosphate reductase n=1 Tax=Labrys okinawensis TaxID=346911 RepID=A0A2S9Q5Z3_9HYPH|nr:4-hydroxy-3-methylbut-2-enyl diphosphate reductase [Labrys okinawensis]PRH84766.1 4-hydroxy-3-methylbut-2-enyl diphosphate reductase [Labrys okinawensis]
MRVILAQPRSFCAGVVRAIDTVERALEFHRAPVYVRHEIVHNRHVVEDLGARGAIFVDELDDVPEGAVTVFSAHGVSRAVENEARERGLQILDATCPLVAKVHEQGRRYAAKGYSVILIGHAGHPEVIGTLGQVPAPVTLVQTLADVAKLPFAGDAPLAYITQTTLGVDDTRGIIEALKQRYPQIVGPDTRDICYATQNRQTAVRELCRHVDVMLIVGSKNSSNTRRLWEIATEVGVRSHQLEDGSEFRTEWVNGAETIGITAGASTPEAMVQDVIATLKRLTGNVSIDVLPGKQERVSFRLPQELV